MKINIADIRKGASTYLGVVTKERPVSHGNRFGIHVGDKHYYVNNMYAENFDAILQEMDLGYIEVEVLKEKPMGCSPMCTDAIDIVDLRIPDEYKILEVKSVAFPAWCYTPVMKFPCDRCKKLVHTRIQLNREWLCGDCFEEAKEEK